MVELLVPADAEVALVAALADVGESAALGAVHVGTRMPLTLPADFVRVTVTGGVQRDLVTDQHLMLVEAYSTSEGRAQRLCGFALAIAQACGRAGSMGAEVCYGVAVGALPQNLPDPTTPNHFRFTVTISADLRRSSV